MTSILYKFTIFAFSLLNEKKDQSSSDLRLQVNKVF